MLGVLGVLAAGLISTWVATGCHRYPEETTLPRRPNAWWAVPVLATAEFTLGERLAGAPWIVVATYAASLVGMALLTAIDLDVARLPDRLTLPAYPCLAVLLLGCSWAAADYGAWLSAMVSGVSLGGAFLVLALISPRGLGIGDVKLAGLLGMLVGWLAWPLVIIAGLGAFVLGAMVGLVLILAGRATRSTPVPFGPSMMAAAMLTINVPPGAWQAVAGGV